MAANEITQIKKREKIRHEFTLISRIKRRTFLGKEDHRLKEENTEKIAKVEEVVKK